MRQIQHLLSRIPHLVRRHKMLSVFIVLLVVFLVLVFAAYRINNPPANVTFKTYAPTSLPNGTNIQDKYLEVMFYGRSHPTVTTLNFDLDNHSLISETNNDGTAQAYFNYSCDMAGGSKCNTAVTTKGQRYLTLDREVLWLKGDTLITFYNNAANGQELSVSALGQFIDSFKPFDYHGLKKKVTNEVAP